MGKLKIAIIGVGSIAQEHIRAYQANPLVELYAFCDINPQRLALMGQQHGISNCYTDQALMHEKHPEIDRNIENSAAEYAKEHDNFIIDARLRMVCCARIF